LCGQNFHVIKHRQFGFDLLECVKHGGHGYQMS
jgi:hypothetical protein